jgi:Zn-finger in ubiquitin-hydrolases and other protein
MFYILGPQVSKESTPNVEVSIANPVKIEASTITEGDKIKTDKAEAVKTEAVVGASETQEASHRIPCEAKAAVSIWLCLRCGSQACGGNVKDHSWGHFSQPRYLYNPFM